MSFRRWIQQLFSPATHSITAPVAKVLITQSCLEAIGSGLEPEIRKGHEGIVYLLGRTDGVNTLAIAVFRPQAITTRGSFHVEPRAMIGCMQIAARYELLVVGQLHTHPGDAYHSDGDVEGARIRYPGYASVVLPNYGRQLPDLKGAAAYLWDAGGVWRELASHDLIIIPGSGPWTNSNGTTSGTTGLSGTRRVV
jgi:proteasome lid subunit RPN8/RPN11